MAATRTGVGATEIFSPVGWAKNKDHKPLILQPKRGNYITIRNILVPRHENTWTVSLEVGRYLGQSASYPGQGKRQPAQPAGHRGQWARAGLSVTQGHSPCCYSIQAASRSASNIPTHPSGVSVSLWCNLRHSLLQAFYHTKIYLIKRNFTCADPQHVWYYCFVLSSVPICT